MAVIGTAGHVDHGKSTLVEALTGRDPDRWDEEKRRGLTIDLGFAWTTVGGVEVSFVDVPGHERFVKNMLAGIEAVDAAILVIAADEGWMPQTEEHAAVLDLLELDRVVVAMTKVDRVDEMTLEIARDETRERLAGFGFADAPMVDVSAPSRIGLEELGQVLGEFVRQSTRTGPPVPHVWIDRAFTVAGAGTVVTGTLQGGPIERDQAVSLQVGGLSARIRGIQTHERVVERAEPRRRVALNLGGVTVTDAGRGTLVTIGDRWTESDRVLVTLRPARYTELDERGAFHFHMGTGAWPCRVQLVAEHAAVIRLRTAAPVVFGAPFILRESGRRLVVAGGSVLDPSPPRRTADVRSAAGLLRAAESIDEAATAMLTIRGSAEPAVLSRDTAGGVPNDSATKLGARYFTAQTVADLEAEATELLDTFHETHPLRPGIPAAELCERLRMDAAELDALAERAGWTRRGAAVALPTHRNTLDPDQEQEWRRIEASLQHSWRVPRVSELGAEPELLAALIGDGRLVRVSDDLVYLPEQLASITAALADVDQPFTVSEFRQALDLSRKYAVPLLEWLDRDGVTRRTGDTRVLRDKGKS